MGIQKQFYIGDPCYVIRDEEWSDFLSALWKAEESEDFDGNFTWKGENVFCHSTAHGDGCYESTKGGVPSARFPVDAGLIGAIPLTLCNQPDDDEIVVEMTDSSNLGSCEDGLFLIHTYMIPTKDEDEDEDHECENCGRVVECSYDTLCWTCEQDEELAI